MLYKELTLRANMPEDISTEIIYEVAVARADRAEFLRINILNEETGDVSFKKRYSTLIRILKNMKSDGRIQFFATKESFRLLNTEAIFLQNKYPSHFDYTNLLEENGDFIYIKL